MVTTSLRAIGDIAAYSCNIGYAIIGSSTRTCQSSGVWSGSEPSCQESQPCPVLPHPVNGNVAILGSIATYTCNPGYTRVGSNARLCQSRRWTGTALTCVRPCPTLPPPLNGRVSASGGTATYTCSTGYTLSGSSTRTCQTNGAWSGTAPTCGGLQCPELSQPSGGTVTINSRTPGRGIAFYRCNTGNLIGPSFITCQDGGTWSGNAPTCQAPQCPTLLPPLNGRVSASEGTATYTCSTGYTLSGSSTRTCVSSGQWSGNAPTCKQVQCPVLPTPTNGGVLSPSRAIGSLAIYTCNPGYTLSGSSRQTCLTNGVWSASQPTCATGFMLRGETFTNTSSVSLEDIGETDEALIFRTEIKDCCRVQRIGQCYDPNGVELGTRAARNEMYRNRDSQMVRLNKIDVFTGEAAILGMYCCAVPNNDGNLHRICANITP